MSDMTIDNIDPTLLPNHVGIIMDGNGRWAKKRNLPRTSGHNEGVKTAKEIVRTASEMGIPYLSLYTFSTENWKRATEEVSFLMQLIKLHLRKEFEFYKEHNIRITFSGDPENIPPAILAELNSAQEETADFSGMILNLAINYGGRDEILRAFNRWLVKHGDPDKWEHVDENEFRTYLDHPEIPDLDLIIRTGGEQRISNFFIWQGAYAELYFNDILWPDWGPSDFRQAILDFQNRDRRFGGAK